MERIKVGLIVNPISGLGGPIGYKGTDDPQIVTEALKMGYKPKSPLRAAEALKVLRDLPIVIYTYSGLMGEKSAQIARVKYKIIGRPASPRTTYMDTITAAKAMLKLKLPLIMFSGGDGTAVNIIDAVDLKIPVVGIPAGVKMYSGVFAVSPRAAGALAREYLTRGLPLIEEEVLDISEEDYRRDVLNVKLYGYLKVPYVPEVLQGEKQPSGINERGVMDGIAKHVVEEMNGETCYILGPGLTVKAIADALGVEKTLLGFDVVRKGRIIVKDASEASLLSISEKCRKIKLILSPLGGSGFLIGRGNLQLTPRILRKIGKDNIIIVATQRKLRNLKKLLIDTGDAELDRELTGYYRVITGYREELIFKVLSV